MDARELTVALGGKWRGRYGLACCPAHADSHPSLSISDGRDGKLLLKCFADCEFAEIMAALRSRGILQNGDDHHRDWSPDPEVERQRRNAELRDRRRRVETAQRAWRRARPIEPGDPVDAYLTSRGLAGPWPATLRTLWRPWQWRGAGVPVAMIAAATRWPAREVMAVQVTALTVDGRKAEVEPIRKTFGILTGATARLAPWSAGMPIAITEGVEDGLSVMQAAPGVVPWIVFGAGMARSVVLPGGCRVILALDSDGAGRKATHAAAERFMAGGHQIQIARPPAGMDFNDVLQQGISV